MGAIASHEVQRLAFECGPSSKREPGVYGAFGLLIAYIMVLTYGVIGNFSIEKFEATMNIAAIAGFVVLYAAFWPSTRRYLADAGNEQPRRGLRHRVDPKAVSGALSLDQWGPRHIIGFINE